MTIFVLWFTIFPSKWLGFHCKWILKTLCLTTGPTATFSCWSYHVLKATNYLKTIQSRCFLLIYGFPKIRIQDIAYQKIILCCKNQELNDACSQYFSRFKIRFWTIPCTRVNVIQNQPPENLDNRIFYLTISMFTFHFNLDCNLALQLGLKSYQCRPVQ